MMLGIHGALVNLIGPMSRYLQTYIICRHFLQLVHPILELEKRDCSLGYLQLLTALIKAVRTSTYNVKQCKNKYASKHSKPLPLEQLASSLNFWTETDRRHLATEERKPAVGGLYGGSRLGSPPPGNAVLENHAAVFRPSFIFILQAVSTTFTVPCTMDQFILNLLET